MITQDNIFKHELIGLHATVTDSANPQLIGMSGDIIDETKSTIILKTKSGVKTIPKDINTWSFMVSGQSMQVEGAKISKRPAERLIIKT